MDDGTHTLMQGLVQRAAAPGAHGERVLYYPNDGHNNPPPSPTAKWKHDSHVYHEVEKAPERLPYRPHPFPLKRRPKAQSGHPGGFVSLQEPLVTPKFPDEEQIHMTYAEWWQAQHPDKGPPQEKDATFSTSFWPYGRRISSVTSMDKEGQYYHLDNRLVKNHTFFKEKRDPATSSQPMYQQRSHSTAAQLLGSQAEHFGYDRSLGRSMSSHASSTFHKQNQLQPGQPFAATPKSGRNAWESMRAQASSTAAGSLPRSTSAPNIALESLEAKARDSRYAPKQKLRDMGLASRTHYEWCLPQPPAYKDS